MIRVKYNYQNKVFIKEMSLTNFSIWVYQYHQDIIKVEWV